MYLTVDFVGLMGQWEVDLLGVDLVGVDFMRVDLVGGHLIMMCSQFRFVFGKSS